MREEDVKRLLRDLFIWLLRDDHKRELKRRWNVVGEKTSLTCKGNVKMKMTDTQQVVATIENEVDAKGNPSGATPTSVVITLDKPDFVSYVVAADNGSVTFTSIGPLGSTQVTAEVKFSDSTDLTVIDTIEVIGGATAKFGFDFGTPTEQVPPAPAPAA